VIEARFDDLTGADPSFRLVEPVGVLEATRSDEVPSVLDAAEAASARGLWVAGFLAYEASRGLDPSLRVRTGTEADPFRGLPLAWFALFEGRTDATLPDPPHDAPTAVLDPWIPATDRDAFDRANAALRARIAEGSVSWVHQALSLRARLDGDPHGLYRDLCLAQRTRYGAFLDLGPFRVLSASPELLFRIDGDRITARPSTGAMVRGRWPAEDEDVRERLRSSEEARAELAATVDVVRNDLGRIARPGSVGSPDAFRPERLETIWRLTSTVDATLASGTGLLDVLSALFPAASVTGAPKISAMGILAELEDTPRGVFGGTIGYLAPTGSGGPRARFHVATGTAVHDAGSGLAVYGVGRSVLWAPLAGSAYEETLAAARAAAERRPAFLLLETLRHDPGEGYRRLDEHLARLASSAGFFGFAFDRRVAVATLEREAARFPGHAARVRLLLDRGGRLEAGSAPLEAAPEPVRLAIDRGGSVDPTDPFLFHKTTLRTRYEEAADRHPEADDVVLVNVLGEATETTVANLAVRLEGTWCTPPLTSGLLPGCERAALLADGTLVERRIGVAELERAGAVAVLSSVRGWRAASLV
jgi:para-aminobenzoate synthetase/4-amino-4-deoxychorismate lyase